MMGNQKLQLSHNLTNRDITLQTKSDISLMNRILCKDETALAMLYDRYKTTIFSLLFFRLKDRAKAENVLQEVFLHVWRRSSTFDQDYDDLFTWLVKLTHIKVSESIEN
jgi:RNA polymerase sigma-70 factor, ECF subfamily